MTTKLLSGKIAIVTGASSGIGRATALAFAKHGATVVCADRSQVHQATHEVVQRQGGTSEFFQTDVSDEGSVLRLIKGTVAKFGRLDIMVNNAGIASEAANPRPIWETPESVFDDTWRVNARGVFLGCKYAGMQMLRQGDASQNRNRAGAIINVGSVLGVLGKAGTPAYAATKGAVIAMTRAAAMDFAPHKIYCNSVLPGFTQTSMISSMTDDGDVERQVALGHPMGRLGEPEEIADTVVFLASPLSDGITGANISVDGGLHSRLAV